MRRYNPTVVEPKWQKVWQDSDLYRADISAAKDKLYVIPMLPYPSGDLHVGHWYNFAPTDAIARYQRMLGKNVLTTIGFDAFGLPAENAAIQRGIQPAKWTYSNIESMTKQLHKIGASYDWSHSLITCQPEYYRWNQWLFLQMYKRGLAYRAKAVVNWCPKDKTVLANEQVVGENNHCERCGTAVIQKEMEQWFFKISDYTERLLDDLDKVDWPERVKAMQINWIGKSQGALVDFEAEGSKGKIQVFTTRPDTIYGATYMVLAPEHPFVEKLVTDGQKPAVVKYVAEAGRKTELERKEGEKNKTGVFSGSFAINPATKERIPVWIADYVLMGYGTGAIMAVPAHDDRDYDFAIKHQLPIKTVIVEDFGEPLPDEEYVKGVVVIPYDLKTGKYLALDKWADAVGLVGGGLNKEETYEDCARRELAEETGITHVKEWIRLGEGVYSHYYNNLKGVNKRSYGEGFLAIVEGAGSSKASPEAHETFEPAWMTMAEIRNGLEKLRPTKGSGGVDHWFEMCDRAEATVKAYQKGIERHKSPYVGEGVLINSDKYDGMSSSEAREKIVADLSKKSVAKEQTNYRLRDWLISRQRYWGTPIPIVYCEKCGMQPVGEDQLPVILPEDVEFKLTGRSPLQDREDFVNAECPKCGGPAKRETDTMDTFVDSSWYFLRYID
ncbi:MAG: class I tRNA ligase family protein, partial [Candidatus Saccharimonadales bacterium]